VPCRPPARSGVKLLPHSHLQAVEKLPSGEKIALMKVGDTVERLGPFDEIVIAVGREPQTKSLRLDLAGVKAGAPVAPAVPWVHRRL